MRVASLMLALTASVLGATAVRADNTPWAAGVPDARQAKANALFAEANALFEQGKHAPAIEKYRAAIALWDHPMIRFNMAVTLIRVDQFVEAADALAAALRFGKTPFTPELHAQAIDYEHLLRGRVGTIAVSCDQAGAHVWLDGKRWFTCAGDKQIRVLAGEHVLLAEKAGLMTFSQQIIVKGADVSRHTVELLPIEPHLRYPTPRWIPWSVVAGGAAVGVAGLGVWFAARNQMDRFEAAHLQACGNRCTEELSEMPALRDMRDSAELKGSIGVSLMVAGGAIAASGLVWATVINRPTTVVPSVDVAPTPNGATVSARWKVW